MLSMSASTRRVRKEFAAGEYSHPALGVFGKLVSRGAKKKAEARSGLPPLSREKHRYGFIGMYIGSLGWPALTL